MVIKLQSPSYFVFDLDDTLFPEITFLISGFTAIIRQLDLPDKGKILEQMLERYRNRENAFSWLQMHCAARGIDGAVHHFLDHYRSHLPEIKLAEEVASFLEGLRQHNIPAGLITDGRSVTQRNKLKALGIENYFSDIIISEEFGSEKPCERNYEYFTVKYPNYSFYFFGDNTTKDFIVPQSLGWTVFCLKDKGQNIHKQNLEGFLPTEIISSFSELEIVSE